MCKLNYPIFNFDISYLFIYLFMCPRRQSVAKTSYELKKSKQFDGSSVMINPSSMSGKHNAASEFTKVDVNTYYSPCDRLGRNYTLSAAGLTMKHAGFVTKLLNSDPNHAGKKVVGFSLASTAPNATINFDGGDFSNNIAIEQKDDATHLFTTTSTLREDHRMIRSKAKNHFKPPLNTSKQPGSPSYADKFENWNPESIDDHISDNVLVGKSIEDRIKLKTVQYELFMKLVSDLYYRGVGIAVGSGKRIPVSSMKSRNLISIIARIPTSRGFLELPAVNALLEELLAFPRDALYNISQKIVHTRGRLDDKETKLMLEQLLALPIEDLESVRSEFKMAIAKSSLLYDIQDPVKVSNYGLIIAHLNDKEVNELWINREYISAEWRVLRQTNLDSNAIRSSFRKIESNLITPLPILLELQYFWMNGTFPQAVWDSMRTISKCQYCELLFVDIIGPSFKQRMPFSCDDFATTIDTFSKDMKAALLGYWLVTVGEKLSKYVSTLPSDNYSNSVDGTGEADTVIDTVKSKDNKVKRNRAEKILDTAVVLLSKQLRGMCESSLSVLSNLFTRLLLPSSPDYSIFIINLKFKKLRSKEVTNELSEPVEICIQPSLQDFKACITSTVSSIVGASRGFSRPEQIIGPTFGGSNSGMVQNLLTNMRHKKMNECSVNINDAIVQSTAQAINEAIDAKFQEPALLLQRLSFLKSLLSGAEAERVAKGIQLAAEAASVAEGLEILGVICKDLDNLIEQIKNALPDIINYSMFEVRTVEFKEASIKYVKSLQSQILETIADENRNHMINLSAKYQKIANTLVGEITDSAELKTLQDYTNKCASMFTDMYDQYVTCCYERVHFLLIYKYKLVRDDIQILFTTFSWPANIQTYLKRSFEAQATRKQELEELLEEDQRRLENDCNDLAKRVELIAENSNPMEFRKIVERISAIKRDAELKQEKAEEIAERETLLEVPHTDVTGKLEEIKILIDPLDRLWATIKSFVEKTHTWNESPAAEINAEEAERTSDELYRTLVKATKEFDKMGEKRVTAKKVAETIQGEVKELITDNIPLMLLVCNPGMRERHWADIERLTGLSIPKDDTISISMLLETGLQQYCKEIEETCVSANKEYSLQIALDKMENEWKEMIFDTKEYRTTGTRILCGIDEIQQLLDDQIVKIQAMRSSRYIKPFIEQCTKWETTLVNMQDILDNWLKVQATWLYLEPIFSSDDIMRQMPVEGKMFKAVDMTWRTSMAQTFSEPSCVKVARRNGFLESLQEANAKLEQIQKGLNDYLETKRLAFPRFFFLSNDELLEILAETKDPLRVQPHLKKCFDGIAKLQFQPNMDIVACYDPKGEKLDFPYDKVNHKKINPNDSGGNVELWLIEVEAIMKKSLAYAIDFAMKDFLQSDRIEWISRWQGQVIIAINQTRWCVDVEKVLLDGPAGPGLEGYYKTLCDELMRTVAVVRGDISKQLRIAVGSLVVMDVHNRDTIYDMWQLNVQSKTEFDWLSQLRYYWTPDGQSAKEGKPGSIQCCMINAMVLYAYEYIGNQDRLVITPLTDRCYRTLMGAIHLNLGGAPEGPAGTGKTETTKDLAKAIAIQCVVTNCSDGLDYLAMAKFFKGLASSGSWACFDEFNRIQLEVLSVVAQQIMQIQLAKMKGLERFVFEGTELELKPTCCPFITMNPGYAGRAELPDNLKVLFRTVAMMVPDYAMISEIILYSYGYTTARPLSVKIVTTYKLCSEQLSSQSHYDYGMRAVIAVLRAAGNLKRSDGHLSEDVLVLRSIIDVNLPKFLSPDVPLFNGIVSDLFPGVKIDPPDTAAMKQAFEDICEMHGLIAEHYFWEKVVQIYDMMVVRHGFMIVGLPFSGKSSAWKVLGDVLGLLSERYPDDKRWSKVIPIIQNPKSITIGQLYGQFDPVSHEWTDGVLAINYRMAASNKIGEEKDRKWILFDGPVDALWIENMNTVLDDNKKLCLMSGEIIAMTDVMSMMFEPMDLLVASPATVSRCGMVYMEPERLGWKPIFKSWIEKNSENGKFIGLKHNDDGTEFTPMLTKADVTLIDGLVNWLIDPCLCFVRKEVLEMSPTVDTNLVMSFLNLFEALLQRGMVKYNKTNDSEAQVDDATMKKNAKQKQQDIECSFFFALLWSIGRSGVSSSLTKFGSYVSGILLSIDSIETEFVAVWNALMLRGWKKPDIHTAPWKGTFILPMPVKHDYYEFVYIPEESKWKDWSSLLPAFSIPVGAPYNSIVIPNNYSAQYKHVIELLMPLKKHILMCGPTGTGKSVYVNASTTSLPKELYKCLSLGFSAKTSSNMTQDIIDGKLDKRRKGVYGPPMGQHCIIFVDDLNMPEVEFYGAQPPIELVRQLIDNGGWYDLKDKTWRSIVDTSIIAAMGPAGGGRNSVTPRLLRHFNLFSFGEFDDNSLRKIFSTILQWHFTSYPFSQDIVSLVEPVVAATLDTYRAVMSVLLPTPLKSHYTFNLRDFSRVVQGILLGKPNESFNKQYLFRLWTHEALRVFSDRLIDDGDRDWFLSHIETVATNKFGLNLYDTFKFLDKDNKKTITSSDLRSCLYGDYMNPADDTKPYIEIQDMEVFRLKMEEYLAEYNAQSRKPMDLVMFGFAMEHISRVCRILKMPGGNTLLVGVGGSGRQSVTRLASFIAGYNVFQIEISKNYTNTEWREDLKSVLRGAGTGAMPLTFFFSDTQIKNESFVEDINNMLNNGEVPNIFPSDERSAICEAVRPFARQVYGKGAADMTAQDLYAFFIQRVKQNLHIVLAFSPIGEAYRDRLRKFPALINCCTINWFTAWPSDALLAVAQKFLRDVKFESEKTRSAIVVLCQHFHEDVIALSTSFLSKLKRRNYVTPTSYLELIIAFKQNLDTKRVEVAGARSRYEVGLEKLAFAAEQVNQMQKELEDLQPELLKSATATEALMGEIEQKMPGVMETRKIVGEEAAIAQREADIVQGQKDEVAADLAVAIPALEAAVEALNTIKPTDINEIKALSKPPEKIRMVCRAVCIMLGIKPVRIPDPEDPSKRIMDYWGPSQKMLADSGFLNSLLSYDKDNMDKKIVAEIKKDFIENPDFNPEIIAKASKAAEGMCRWCGAMITYDSVAKVVAPKKAALAEAEEKLNVTMAALNEKKSALQKVEDELTKLQNDLAAAKNKKESLENQADLCDKKIVRANQLLDGLGGERDRWFEFAKQLGSRYERLTGDVFISAALIAYLGPFTALFRLKQMNQWVKKLKEHDIPCSDSPTLTATLGNQVRIRQWNIEGLPTDAFSIDNGLIVFNARRWPLMIDPQGQANKWIRNMERPHNLQVVKLSDTNYLRVLENAIQFGSPVLMENIGEELDPSLEPLLQKQIFKQGGINCIRLGDATVEYSENFRFYMTTKLRNPHYLPEVSVKVTLLNFMITPEGLQDQLLGIVVSQERPDLEEQKNRLILESAQNKRLLKEIEDKILHIMSSSSGNILEDETAISTLKESKTLSDEIARKQAIAEETEQNIDIVRQSYSPVAYSSQILFFCIADLANIEPVYQYSLTWFINLFISSIVNSEKGKDVEKRLQNLDEHFTYSLYRNVCRSLLEKDKLLFSFLLSSRIMGGKGQKDENDWFFLLSGGAGMDNPNPNPAPEWLTPKCWDSVCKLSQLERYKSFKEDFAKHINEWKFIYDSISPQNEQFPGIFASDTGLGRLCALRTIRPDKVILAVQQFVTGYMGEKYVKPPPFDLQACYNDSSPVVPLIFILSAGSDPMSAVFRAAELLKITVDPISLGQGQGPKAEKLIEKAKQKGSWVVLQNCHLAPSWMTTLEKICEELDPDECHNQFRLWCTTYPSDVFPVAVLQNGVKMTKEAPKGIRANLIGSFNADPIANEEFFNKSSKSKEFHRLIFGLCFFHALVQERRLYGPLGWNIPYEFNESDLRISVQQLQLFLDENEFIPYKALIYTAGECNYGGRVTDDKDRRTLLCILKRFYKADFLNEEHNISESGSFKCPPDGSWQDYIDYIDNFPLIASPEVFGLHENATLTKDQNDTNNLLNAILDTEGGGGGGSGSGPSKEDVILIVAADIANKVPENYNLEFAQLKYPVKMEESMNTVLCQELIRFNGLLTVMRDSLNNVQKAVKGLVVMSADLDVLGNSLFVNRTPAMWKARSYPSLKPLSGYISDQGARLEFFSNWLNDKPPVLFWISGFFFTQAFLTGASQNYARKYTIPIDDVVFDWEMQQEDIHTKAPENGVLTYGFFIEGGRWCKESRNLAESLPKVLFSPAPTMHWIPMRKADIPVYPHYKCPVYKTSDRRGVLATTGHSSNFVCFIHMPSEKTEDHWVERGMAMLTSLDD